MRRVARATLLAVVISFAGCTSTDHDADGGQDHAPGPGPQGDLWRAIYESEPTCCAAMPMAHEFDAQGKLWVRQGPERHPVTFGAWGGHAAGHTGHVEGDNKANFRVLLRPTGKIVELVGNRDHNENGNGNGVCEPGEGCGVTAEDAFAFAPWYVAPRDLYIGGFARDPPVKGEYLPGQDKARLFLFAPGMSLTLQHVGKVSDALVQILRDAGQEGILDTPAGQGEVFLKAPVAVPQGTVIARPQIAQGGEPASVGGKEIFYATAQTEWNWSTTAVSDDGHAPLPCQYGLFSADDQRAFQRALDSEIRDPTPWGPFVAKDANGLALETVAEMSACASELQDDRNYGALDTQRGYGWFDLLNANPRREAFALFPVHRDTVAYDANKARFNSPDVAYMIIRSFQEPGLGPDIRFPLAYAGATQSVRLLSAEIIDLPEGKATAGPHLMTAKISRMSGFDGPDLTGKYFAIRYDLRSDRVIVAWGSVADTASTVVAPPAPPAGAVACDAAPYSCYTHDISIGAPK